MRTLLAFLAFCLLAAQIGLAEPAPDANKTSDPIWTRSSLLDFPEGPKHSLRNCGIGFDASLTQFYQGVVSGDGDKEWQYGGKGDLIVTLDGARLRLWKGFYLNAHLEWVYGEDANTQGDGSLFPLNTALGFPTLGGHGQDLSIVVTQQFNDDLTVNFGKFNLLDSAAKTPLAGGGGLDTFMNTALAAPISGVTPPYLLGVIAALKTKPATFTLMVYDPRNAQDWDVIESPFDEGVTTSLSVTIPTLICGLKGFYGLRGVYSSKEGLDLTDVPGLLLPEESEAVLTRDGYWYCSFSVQQYLYQNPNNPQVGWGVFADVAVSDGNPNPFGWHVLGGLAGNSPIPGRGLDRWGLAYFRYGLSDDLLDGLNDLGFRFQDEQGAEMFYNCALTPWLRVTADLQGIDPHEKDKDIAVVAAIRAQLRF